MKLYTTEERLLQSVRELEQCLLKEIYDVNFFVDSRATETVGQRAERWRHWDLEIL